VLTGELEPTSGAVWKHPNLRIAYVAQHAFHHIEQHLEKTPNEYIRWRYAIGEDRENLSKVTRQVRVCGCCLCWRILGLSSPLGLAYLW
jgi:elongation factor 3